MAAVFFIEGITQSRGAAVIIMREPDRLSFCPGLGHDYAVCKAR